MSGVRVRNATAQDEGAWRKLWAGYVTFYGVDVPEDVTAATWARAMDAASSLFMRVSELDGRVNGFALCLLHEATWVKQPVCYLEDLFVDPSVRGKGVGRALLDDLVVMAKEKGWARLYWHTNENNAAARRLYDHYIKADDHVRYRMSF